MKMKLLKNKEYQKIKSKLDSAWDITKPYWYPLFDCNREDVIAFDSEYIESSDKLELIRKLLKEHDVETVYEFREDGISNEIIDFLHYEFWCSEPYFWNNECFWFDCTMDWIIYVSHEGTITFGGKWLVEELKKVWVDWKNNISWDTKN